MKRRFFEDLKAIARVLHGYSYDCLRYMRCARVVKTKTRSQHSYLATKNYHSLEKSLSFATRSKESGWSAANALVSLFETSRFTDTPRTGQEQIALRVLREFLAAAPEEHPERERLLTFLSRINESDIGKEGGALEITSADIAQGTLFDPESFFMTRRSVRAFSSRPVEEELIRRAITLATATPSVCNRQAWHVYFLEDRDTIDKALSHQNGNRGFGHEVPCLLIVAADLEGFVTGYERYQPWIDGGMFAMTLVLSLHSLGLATCCLNWSQGPRGDLTFRKEFPISYKHSIITMIAVGYPPDVLKVCASARRPLEDFLTKISS